jgi:FMN reductase
MTSAVAISGSPSRESKSRRLLAYALARCSDAGLQTRLIDLCELAADDLLGRTKSPAIAEALTAVSAARIVIVGTPVYRASYSGMLKVFFDLFTMDALDQKIAIPIATGGGPAHQLVIDYALRPLLASVGAHIVATGVYATDAQFGADGPQQAVTARLDRAVTEALAIADLAAQSSYSKR